MALVDEMLVIADQYKVRADARFTWLENWVRTNMAPGGKWNGRRLVLFTEWEATRRWKRSWLEHAVRFRRPRPGRRSRPFESTNGREWFASWLSKTFPSTPRVNLWPRGFVHGRFSYA
jgi:hypothetical protein